MVPLPGLDESIEGGDYNKLNPLLILTTLAKDEDYSEELHFIE